MKTLKIDNLQTLLRVDDYIASCLHPLLRGYSFTDLSTFQPPYNVKVKKDLCKRIKQLEVREWGVATIELEYVFTDWQPTEKQNEQPLGWINSKKEKFILKEIEKIDAERMYSGDYKNEVLFTIKRISKTEWQFYDYENFDSIKLFKI